MTQIQKLMRAYDINLEEAQELHEYDTKYTNTDKDSEFYLRDNELSNAEDLGLAFNKIMPKPDQKPKIQKKRSQAKEVAKVTNTMVNTISAAMKEDEHYQDVEVQKSSITAIAPETGKRITVKITNHKKPTSGARKYNFEDLTPVQNRIILIQDTVTKHMDGWDLKDQDLFSTGIGFSQDHLTYPFGSVKITHHKD